MKVDDKKLPAGWRLVPLGDIAQYINGRAFKPAEWGEKGLPIIRIQNLNSKDAHYNYYEGDIEERYKVENGDLLISWSASLDAFLWNEGPAVLNQHIFKVVENPNLVTRDYLYFIAKETMNEIRSQVHGSTMKHITKPQFEKIQVPIPRMNEQKRITQLLYKHMSSIDKAKAAAEAQLEAAKALPAAYLREVFSSPEAQKWPKKKIGQVCQMNPRRPSSLDRSDDAPTTFVPMTAVDQNLKAIIAPEIKPYKNVKKGYTFFTENDVLFAKITPCMQNGKHAIAKSLIDGIGFGSTEFHVLHPGPEITSDWIHRFISQPTVLQNAMAHFTGAVGQQRVSGDYLSNLEIPVPALEIQKRIMKKIIEDKSNVEALENKINELLKDINYLPSATLRQAFNGEL